ncbi:MAG TPA: tetratricopeptide repeat protein [Candidatus Omnitrophota bacterium]|nr:tetratricopeptide repeat protein [Candidatus Omnitrophota bacterium]
MKNKIIYLLIIFFLISTFPCQAQTSETELFLISQKAFEDGFYDVAIRYIEQFTQNYPQTSKRNEAKLLLGQCYFFKGQFLKAFGIFQELSSLPNYQDAASFWLGETYLKNKDYPQARNHYKKILDLHPRSDYAPQAAYALAWIDFELNQFEEAEEKFKNFLINYPQHALAEDAAFRIGECKYNLTQYSKAVQSFQSYIQTFSRSNRLDQAHFYIAESQYYLQEFQESIKSYGIVDRETKSDRTRILSYIGIAWGHLRLKQFTEAQKAFEQAQKISDEKKIVMEEPLFGLATLYAESNDLEKALQTYQKIVTDHPQSTRLHEALLGKANILYMNERYDDAIEIYKKVLSDPSKLITAASIIEKAGLGLAWTYLKNGNAPKAIETFQSVISSTTNKIIKVSALTQIADAYQDLGQFQQALNAYDTILQNYPDTPYTDYAQYRQGIALLKLERVNSAILSFQSLQKNFPQSRYLAEAGYYLGIAHFNKGDWLAAKECMTKFIRELPADHQLQPDAHYIMALCSQNLKEHDEAMKTFRKIERVYPHDITLTQKVRFGIAKNLYEKGAIADALKEFKLIQYKYPKTAVALQALLWLGEYYTQTRDFQNAILYYEQVINDYLSDPDRAEAIFALGDIFYKKGDYDKALTYFKQITPLHGQSIYAKAKLAIADTFAQQLSPQVAVETYENIIKNSPEFSREAYLKMAEVYQRSDEKDKAIMAYYKALEAKQNQDIRTISDCEIRFAIADLLELSGKPKQAIDEYLKIPYLYPTEIKWIVKSYLRAARLFENKEDLASARTSYEKIMSYPVEERAFAQERIDRINAELQQ